MTTTTSKELQVRITADSKGTIGAFRDLKKQVATLKTDFAAATAEVAALVKEANVGKLRLLDEAKAQASQAAQRVAELKQQLIGLDRIDYKSGMAGLNEFNRDLARAKKAVTGATAEMALHNAKVAQLGATAATALPQYASRLEQAKNRARELKVAVAEQSVALENSRRALTKVGIGTTSLNADVARLRKTAVEAAQATGQIGLNPAKTRQMKQALEDTRQAASGLGDLSRQIAGYLGAALGVRALAALSDGYSNLQSRLKLVSRNQGEFNIANADLVRIATAARAPLEDTATLYTRIAGSVKDLDVSQQKVAGTTEAVALSLRISGASAAESSSTMLQFSQAIASGVLRGEEFNSVAEAAPRLLQALAKSMGVNVGQLREMAKEGKLTRDVLIDGLLAALPTLRAEAASLPQTIGTAFTELNNKLFLTIGRFNEVTGAATGAAESIGAIGSTGIEVLAVLGANLAFVFKCIGTELGGIVAQAARLAALDFTGAAAIGRMMKDDAARRRAELDAYEKRVLGLSNRVRAIPAAPAVSAALTKGTAPAIKPAGASSREQDPLAALLGQTDTAQLEEYDRLLGMLVNHWNAGRLSLEQFTQAMNLLVERTFGDKIKAAREALAADMEFDAEVQASAQAVADENLARIRERLELQAEFMDDLEKEAHLASLANDERETALLLLEAKKLGIADINRLLELQAAIRRNKDAQDAAAELKRQQDGLYQSVQEGVQRAFADGLNNLATGEGGFRGTLQNLASTIRNALSNAIAGSLTQGFLGMLGGKEGVLGMLGSIGMGPKRGDTPANPVYTQDASLKNLPGIGGAGGGGDPGQGGFFSGIADMFKSLASGLGNMLSSLLGNLVSMIGNSIGPALGGIFSLFGFAGGGWTGPGGKYEPRGVVHGDEYVFSKAAVRRIGVSALDNLHRIASGGFVPSMPRLGYADGGLVNLPARPSGQLQPSVNLRINNVLHESLVHDYMTSSAGERVVLNVLRRNTGAINSILR